MSDTMPSDVVEMFRKELEALPTTGPDGEQLPKDAVVQAAAPIIEKIPTSINTSDLEAVATLFKAIVGIGATVIKRSVSERRAREKDHERELQKIKRDAARKEQASKVPSNAIHLRDNSTEVTAYFVTPATEGSTTAIMWSLDLENPAGQFTRVRDLPQPVAQVLYEAERRPLIISPDDVALVITSDDLERGSWLRKCGSRGASNRHHRDLLVEAFERLKDQTPVISPESRVGDTGHVVIPPRGVQPPGWQDKAPGITEDEAIDRWSQWAKLAQEQPGGILAHLAGIVADSYYIGVMRRQPHAVDVFGRDLHTGKSTGTFCLSAMIGNPDQTCIAMDMASPVSLSTLVGRIGVGMAALDESQLFKATATERALTTFRLAQGGQRLRSRTDGSGITRGLPFKGIGLFNGNMRFVDDETMNAVYPGLSRRYFAFPVSSATPVTASKPDATRLKDLALEAYGYLIPRVLSVVTVAMYARLLEAQVEFVSVEYPGVDSEVQSVLAGHLAGAAALDHVLGSDLLSAARAHMHAYLNGGSVHHAVPIEELFLTKVREHIASNSEHWPLYKDYAVHLKPDLAKEAGVFSDGTVREPVRGFRKADGTAFVIASKTQLVDLCRELEIADPDAVVDGLDKAQLLSLTDSQRREGKLQGTVTLARFNGEQIRARGYVLTTSWQEDCEDEGIAPEGGSGGGGSETPSTPSCRGYTSAGKPCGEPMLRDLDGNGIHPGCYSDPSGFGVGTIGAEESGKDPVVPRQVAPQETLTPVSVPSASTVAEGVHVPAPARRESPLSAALGATFAKVDQERAYQERIAVLAAMDPADDSDETINKAASALRIMEAMTDDPGGDKEKDGPFAPLKYGKSSPYWTAPLPDIAHPLVAHQGWGNFTSDVSYQGPAAVLDRNAGHPSALSSLRVAHGKLEQTGALPDAKRPGYYKTVVHPWHRTDLPNPTGNREPGAEVWVTHERMRLLQELTKYGPEWWPGAEIIDSYTAERETSLSDLSKLIKHLRSHVIDTHGKDSVQWEAIKEATNTKLIQIMMGTPKDDAGVDRWTARKWYTKCHRTDWAHALHDKAAMNLLRVAVKLSRADVPVLSVRHMDEIVIPTGQLESVISRGLIKADETGKTFGTFKTKDTEEWGA